MNDRLAYRINELIGPKPEIKKEAGAKAMAAGGGTGAVLGGAAGYYAGGEGNKLISTLAGMFGGGVAGAAMAEYLARKYGEQKGGGALNVPGMRPAAEGEAGKTLARIQNPAATAAGDQAELMDMMKAGYQPPPAAKDPLADLTKPGVTGRNPMDLNISKTQADRRNSRLAESILVLRKEAAGMKGSAADQDAAAGEYPVTEKDKQAFEPNIAKRKEVKAKEDADKKRKESEPFTERHRADIEKTLRTIEHGVNSAYNTVDENKVPIISGTAGAVLGGGAGYALGSKGNRAIPTAIGAGVGTITGAAAPAVYGYLAKKLAERQQA